jgi:peroxiredoxin
MKQAPDFTLLDQNSENHSLQDYRGKWVVLYFYPKDETPGCTVEACGFRDTREAIAEFGNAVVLGVSKDSPESHRKFAEKHGLNFTLLSDPDLVLGLYRDEVYNRASEDAGMAEIIVLKHRNGPTGMAKVAYSGQYTRFANIGNVARAWMGEDL